ncbi:MAG: serine/threonine-protein kinase, partial [Planctomycetota bacterium]
MDFIELTEKLTQQGIDLKQYQRYLNHLYKHSEHKPILTEGQSDSVSDIILEVSTETELPQESQEMHSPLETALEKTVPLIPRAFAKTEKLPLSKSSENMLGDTDLLSPMVAENSVKNPTLVMGNNTSELEELKRVCIQLLIRAKMEIVEVNELLRSTAPDQRNARALLQHLLKKKKIRIDECFEIEQGQWLPAQQEKLPFNVKVLNGCPEFFLTEKLTQQKFGHYQIIRELARGGMGIVYKVYHPGLAQYFALKVLIAGENASEETIRRFHREAKNTAKLKHPGIVQVMDSGEEHGRHYFVMEYVEGQTFGQFLKKRPPLRDGLLIIKKALEALYFAHTQGIIHRDLKPDNIFITQTGDPKIGDFGLAKNVEIDGKSFKITHSGAVLGTPAYMSPEQAAGQLQDVDERTDIYSMGTCLYQLLTQKIPFEAETLHQQLYLIINDEPIPPSRILSDIHKDVDIMVLKSLEKQKVRRYSSALEFAEDIGRFLAGYPIKASPSSRKEFFFRALKRNQQAITVGFVLTTLFIGSTLYIQWSRYQQKQEIQQQEETAFQQLFQKAKQEIHLMNQAESPTDLQKMDSGLHALKSLKRAFQIRSEDPELRKLKLELTQQIILLSCKLEEYALADYLAEEALQTPGFPEEKKEFFLLLLEEEKKKNHEQHYKDFLIGINQLRSELSTEIERESILLKICQWTEPQILTKLQEILKEATDYFLSDRKR